MSNNVFNFPPYDPEEDAGDPRPTIHEDWHADVNDYSFFGQNWSDYLPYTERIKVDQTGTHRPGEDPPDKWRVVTINPLDEIQDEVTYNSLMSLMSWGQGPVVAAMKQLNIFEVNDQETADQVVDWLGENYGQLFEPDFSDLPTINEEKLNYTPVEMDLTYEPKYPESEKTIRKAFGGRAYAGKPQPISLQDYSEVVETNSLYDL